MEVVVGWVFLCVLMLYIWNRDVGVFPLNLDNLTDFDECQDEEGKIGNVFHKKKL